MEILGVKEIDVETKSADHCKEVLTCLLLVRVLLNLLFDQYVNPLVNVIDIFRSQMTNKIGYRWNEVPEKHDKMPQGKFRTGKRQLDDVIENMVTQRSHHTVREHHGTKI